jgi:hypothetical protein
MITIIVLCSFLSIACIITSSLAFVLPSSKQTFSINKSFSQSREIISSPLLLSSSSDENSEANRKRRRKRKDGKSAGEVLQSNPSKGPDIEITATTDEPDVELQVMDVRDILSQSSSSSSPSSGVESVDSSVETPSTSFTESNDSFTKPANLDKDDSMAQLLADAKKMREEAPEEEISAPNAIKSVISTIVTADFFVVCGLLLWFLAGIFCSYIIKDDAVQIAFNNIFEPVVQPALGILMIGSAAGAVFKDESKEEGMR